MFPHAALRHLSHALAIKPHLADTFDAREHVIDRLAADPDQFGAYNAGHKIARKIENLLWRRAVETFAKNCRHRTGERLHFRTKCHPDVRFAVLVYMQINSNRVCAVFVFANIDEIEFFVFARLLLLRVVRVGDERFTPLIFRERLEEIDDVVELLWVHSGRDGFPSRPTYFEFTAD